MAWEFPKIYIQSVGRATREAKPVQVTVGSKPLTWENGEAAKAGDLLAGKQYSFDAIGGKIAPSVGKPNHTREDKLERILECFECNATYAEGKHDYNELLTDARKAGWLVVEKANGNYCYCPKHAAKAWL